MSVPNVKIPATVQTAPIGRPHDPHLSTTLGAVASCRSSAQAQENFLSHVFGFRVISHNSKCDAENQPLVTIDQHSHGVAVAKSEMLHDTIVGKMAEIGISQPARLPKMIAVWRQPFSLYQRNNWPNRDRAYGIVNKP